MKKYNDLNRLSRAQLLEIMIRQSRKIDELTDQLEEANRRLEEKTIVLEQAGSIAEAALQLNEVFASAQKACDQYVRSVEKQSNALYRQTVRKCNQMLEESRTLSLQRPEESDADE